ncbi:MAG: PEP-CTERM sorting domain-containing protein [Gammaproteobacteria bacterium]|nr:MAG: PEP-CTERM sorting domain-containing protein [Gammaproteobacteria bacterium]
MKKTTSLLALGSAHALSGTAHADLITHTDSFGVVWSLESDGLNHGSVSAPVYDLFVYANPTGFHASSRGTNYTSSNAYINHVTVLANARPTSAVTLGPGDMSNTKLWTNTLGGQNSNGCNSTSNTDFDCAYATAGGNNPAKGPGVLMSSTESHLVTSAAPGSTLEWEYELGFAPGTKNPLGFENNESHLKVDYYGYATKKGVSTYGFIGQISDDVTINKCKPGARCRKVPEPTTFALFSVALLGCAIFMRRRR